MMDIALEITPERVRFGGEISGSVSVSYRGRYDGVVVNAQVLDSNHHITYASYNDKKISGSIARLFIPQSEMAGDKARFVAVADFEEERDFELKFRASIIEQHKEIDSAAVFIKLGR